MQIRFWCFAATALRVPPCKLDSFFSENNEATLLFAGLNDLSLQAESNDTHHDHDFKKIGSYLGPFLPRASTGASWPKYENGIANTLGHVFYFGVQIIYLV